MKFIHLSDLHLGKRVNEYSMLEDQELKSLILIRKASPNGAACFVIYKERNHKTSLI